jgi:rhodanese-related sulfurtransferase
VSDLATNDGASPRESVESISAERLAGLMREGPVRLIDVRSQVEFDRLHAQGSVNVPFADLEPKSLPGESGKPVYLICRDGSQSALAAQQLRQAEPGLSVVVVEGGVREWLEADLPIVEVARRRKRWTVEKIVLAVILIVSALLAIFVHRGLLGLAGLAGAWIVARKMLNPRDWPWRDEPEVTEASAN